MAPTYVLIASSKIHPNSNFCVNLEITDQCEPENFEVLISGPSNDGTYNRITKSTLVEPLETGVVNFAIDNWSNGNYKLIVKSKKFLNDIISLEYDKKFCSIFVQTDKPIYEPGQTVKFRSIIVDSNLLPTISCCVNILVKDPRDNLIKQWKQLHPQLGIISEELQLSDQPPLGDWSIIVNVQNQTYTKQFTVSEQVLPTFSVEIQVPPYIAYSKSKVVVSVKAAYTCRRPFKGECTLTGSIRDYNKQMDEIFLPKYQIKQYLTNDGSLNIPLNIVRDLNLNTNYGSHKIKFEASVVESLTGRKSSSFSMTKICNNIIKVNLIEISEHLKPGLKNMVYLKIAYRDGKPVEDNGPAVSLNYYPDNKMGLSRTFESIPVKGLVCVELCEPKFENLPDFNHYICLNARYRGEMYNLGSIEFAESPSNSFIRIYKSETSSIEKSFQVGENVIFQVTSTEPLNHVRYKVISKGNIVLARTEQIVPSLNTVDIAIQITQQMAPKAHLLVYYVRDANREIVADAITFQVEPILSTPLKISSNVDQTEPGQQVDITVQTQPSAYVGLLDVNQSVPTLKSQNYLPQDDVRKELESYDKGKFPICPCRLSMRINNTCVTEQLFANVGVVVLSNGLFYKGHVQFDKLGSLRL